MDAPPGQKKSIFNNYANTAPFLEYKYKITACSCSQEVFTTFAFASKVECKKPVSCESFKSNRLLKHLDAEHIVKLMVDNLFSNYKN